ncbi:MAG TPA: HAD-IG family 5'-nucleotidase [Kofleriaceae bacterium]|nr:HAD-IG family 5'-nucleotidase [Kofleriaceae bacterium]
MIEIISEDIEGQLAAVLGEVKREIDISRRRRIFCNRSLKMESIELLGFDMDYTLALYQQPRLEQLSIELTSKKLCENRGYPDDIRHLSYDSRFAVRGLVVDRALGNVFKMDRYGHVGRVYHGKRLLDEDERHSQYRSTRIRLSQARYAWIDTLFGLPEAAMYITLVDYFAGKKTAPSHPQLFDDIRASIDEAHRDDTLKRVIKADLPGFIIKDPNLAETLHKLRSSGKKMFVLTNSLWDYTDALMSYLLDGERPAYPSWRNYFDIVIVGGQKPGFFAKHEPFRIVDTDTGELSDAGVSQLSSHHVYQGGNIFEFERMSKVKGDHVLYVGDHIYGDILRLKKSHVWRTAMIIQELDNETRIGDEMSDALIDLSLLDRRRRNLESEIDYQNLMLKRLQKMVDGLGADQQRLRSRLSEAHRQARATLETLRGRAKKHAADADALETQIDHAYNPFWGAIFRERHENSRFGQQVSDYADLYTSRVSNFLSYSPLRYFRAPRRQMPHEL